MRKYRTWHEILMEQLADRDDAIDYLQVTLEEYQVDGDTSFFLSEIRTVVEAQGGASKLAESDTNCSPHRENKDRPVTPSEAVDRNLEVATENRDSR